MSIDDLIKKIEEEFDEVTPGAVTPETSFKELDEWSSMHALILIALIDAEYDITLTGDDLKNADTVRDIYEILLKMKA